MASVLSLFSLQGETAIITGSTRGIGAGMAIALASAGATVLLAQRDISNTSTKSRIEAAGGTAHIYHCDVSSPASVTALLPAILADGHNPTILVQAAGITIRHPAEDFPDADYHAVLQANLHSCFTLARTFGAHLLSAAPASPSTGRRGTIIFIASLMSFQGGLYVPAYAASKGGIASLTKALSNEWAGRGITVNAIAPGYIRTDMTAAVEADPERGPAILARIPAGRWGEAEDFEGVVVFLASRASAYVSGEIVTVDGGWMGR
jgi:2-dehydro-3-deoxy-D-gluconate 5-dehydrogenase